MSFDQNIISIRNWNSSDSGSICSTIKWRRPMIYLLHLTMKCQSQFLKDNGSRENKWICDVALKIYFKALDWSFPTKVGLLIIIKRVWFCPARDIWSLSVFSKPCFAKAFAVVHLRLVNKKMATSKRCTLITKFQNYTLVLFFVCLEFFCEPIVFQPYLSFGGRQYCWSRTIHNQPANINYTFNHF